MNKLFTPSPSPLGWTSEQQEDFEQKKFITDTLESGLIPDGGAFLVGSVDWLSMYRRLYNESTQWTDMMASAGKAMSMMSADAATISKYRDYLATVPRLTEDQYELVYHNFFKDRDMTLQELMLEHLKKTLNPTQVLGQYAECINSELVTNSLCELFVEQEEDLVYADLFETLKDSEHLRAQGFSTENLEVSRLRMLLKQVVMSRRGMAISTAQMIGLDVTRPIKQREKKTLRYTDPEFEPSLWLRDADAVIARNIGESDYPRTNVANLIKWMEKEPKIADGFSLLLQGEGFPKKTAIVEWLGEFGPVSVSQVHYRVDLNFSRSFAEELISLMNSSPELLRQRMFGIPDMPDPDDEEGRGVVMLHLKHVAVKKDAVVHSDPFSVGRLVDIMSEACNIMQCHFFIECSVANYKSIGAPTTIAGLVRLRYVNIDKGKVLLQVSNYAEDKMFSPVTKAYISTYYYVYKLWVIKTLAAACRDPSSLGGRWNQFPKFFREFTNWNLDDVVIVFPYVHTSVRVRYKRNYFDDSALDELFSDKFTLVQGGLSEANDFVPDPPDEEMEEDNYESEEARTDMIPARNKMRKERDAV
jgi:hypothetical protein